MSSAFIERDAARVLFIPYFCSDECLQRSLFIRGTKQDLQQEVEKIAWV